MYQPSRHLSQMHIMHYARFVFVFGIHDVLLCSLNTRITGTPNLLFKLRSLYTGKGDLLKNCSDQIGDWNYNRLMWSVS